jgi:hypothetical protein
VAKSATRKGSARKGGARKGAQRRTAGKSARATAARAAARRSTRKKGAQTGAAARGRKRAAPARKKPARARKATARRTSARSTRKTARRAAPARRPAAAGRGSRPKTAGVLATAGQAITGAVQKTVAAVASVAPWPAGKGDAIELLEADHRQMETLLAEGEETTEGAVARRTELLARITTELNAHELIEEKLFYPALKAHPEAKDIVLEGYQEHHVVDLIVSELHAMERGDERWGAKFKVLKENIEHHIEEEEGEMFRTARSVMSREELDELGARMRAMKASALGRTM